MARHLPRFLHSVTRESPNLSRAMPLRVAMILCAMCYPTPVWAAYHLNEITKIMAGYNGDVTIQAVEIKMIANFENVVNGARIRIYDASGALVSTLGTFTANVAVGTTGRKILCATSNFASTFGITPDLVISPGIPVTTGQVSFETATCLINAIPYGAISVFKNGPTAAPPLPADGATVLVRVVEDSTTFSCPLREDANFKFRLASGSSGSPITFTNNANASVNVFTTVTAAEGSLRGFDRPRVFPNPIRSRATIEWPGVPLSFVAVYDVNGKRVRAWGVPGLRGTMGGPARITWDGTDDSGRRLASGIYFVQIGTPARRVPVVLLR
ncbi:MAG: hypothetical protein HY568_05305 [Candidatus Latescibacteria bacterium]|nr:hypothetical protein [Candidatus Latescibacterota bacterium]